MKIAEKQRAKELRLEGLSYKEISEQLGVTKSTLSGWLGNIELTEEQKERLSKKCRITSIVSGKKNKERWDELKFKVKENYHPPIDDPEFMLGLGLFWGEGTKKAEASFVNSDLFAIKCYIKWITTYFGAKELCFRVQHYYKEQDENIKIWWASNLGYDISQFRKSTFCISKASKKQRNTLPYGTLSVRTVSKENWKINAQVHKALELVKKI